MADDVKLQLGIDVDALQRSASQATNIISQAFEKSISANLLGNGLVPTQGPSNQSQNNSIADVITAIQQVNRTLVVGFNSLAGGVYLGGGGGGAAGGSPGGGGMVGGAGGGGGGGGVAGGAHLMGGIGGVASGLASVMSSMMPSGMKMVMGGYYSTDVVGFVKDALAQLGPVGRLASAIVSPFHQVMQQNNDFKNMQYELFRDVGEDAMNAFTNLWVDDDRRSRFITNDKRTSGYGFSRAETQQLMQLAARSGVLGEGTPTPGGALDTIMHMQGQLGLGQEAAGAMGALRRGGLKAGQETEAMAEAIGVGIATGLDRGRWGEMVSLWQRAAQSSIDVDVDRKAIAAQQQFIGGLGGRFRGDTPAAQSMDAALRGMASNVQSPLALRAALQATGGDYFAATARMARAAEMDHPDPQLQEAIIDQLAQTSIGRAWLAMPDGPDADRMLERVAGIAAQLGTGLSQLKIITLLKARKMARGALFPGPTPEAVALGRQYVTGKMPTPDVAIEARRSAAEAARPSDISSIQDIGPVAPMSPQDQLRTTAPHIPTVDDLRSGRYTIDPSSLGAAPAAGGQDYQRLVGQRFGNPIAGRAPHPGVDLMFPPGTAITCPVDGVVEYINPNGSGDEVGYDIHIRASDGTLWKIYHLDPSTQHSFRVGQRIARGTPLGRTFTNQFWRNPSGGLTRTHLHVGQMSRAGALLDPMRPGGIEPGSLTGGAAPSMGAGPAAGTAGSAAHMTADIHVYVHQDQAGRPVVRVRSGAPVITSSPGQMVGGHR